MRSALEVAQIDHVVLILDKSGSMQGQSRAIIAATDAQIVSLKRRSEAMKREVRVSVYAFDSDVECLIFDTDVLRLPSIATLYQVGHGLTALADAVHKGIDDLETTSTIYGDHAFLMIAMTDGHENDSSVQGLESLPGRIAGLGLRGNWTTGLLVPNKVAAFAAEALGFPRGNIGVWGNNAAEFARQAEAGVESFTSSRLRGERSTTSLFGNGPENVNPATVASLDLLPATAYRLLPVPGGKTAKYEARPFVEGRSLKYARGVVFYQWTKGEEIGARKEVIVIEKATDTAYTGPEARRIIGLPESVAVKGSPVWNPDYDVFVQSTSPTRRLIGGTRVLVKV